MMRYFVWILVVSMLAACGGDTESQSWEFDEDSDLMSAEPRDEMDEGPNSPPPEAPDDAGVEFWAGTWLVDQPAHALYEATVYDFRAGGTLVEVRSYFLGGEGGYPEVGFVSQCVERETETVESCEPDGTCAPMEYSRCEKWGPTCFFGGRWSAPDSNTLFIEGDCDDDVPRTIELKFDWTVEAATEIIVDGEEWEHNWFAWRWTRCEDAETCVQEF